VDWSFELEGWECESPEAPCEIGTSLEVDGPATDGPATAVAGVGPEALCSPSETVDWSCRACSLPPRMKNDDENICIRKDTKLLHTG
jgi:hypothetical protein